MRADRIRPPLRCVAWPGSTDTIDAVESWIAGQSFWVQIPVLLAVLLPLCWLVAGLIDRVVEYVLRNAHPP